MNLSPTQRLEGLAHAGGSGMDEFVAQVMLFVAIALGVTGWLAHGNKPWWRSWGFVGLAAVVAVSAFVLPQRYLRVRPAAVRPAAGQAAVEILAPGNGVVVSGDSLQAAVRVANARLVGESRRARTGEGHLHVRLDETLLTESGGLNTRVDLRALAPGPHTLTFELVAADHGSFRPPVRDSITFVKEAG